MPLCKFYINTGPLRPPSHKIIIIIIIIKVVIITVMYRLWCHNFDCNWHACSEHKLAWRLKVLSLLRQFLCLCCFGSGLMTVMKTVYMNWNTIMILAVIVTIMKEWKLFHLLKITTLCYVCQPYNHNQNLGNCEESCKQFDQWFKLVK